MCTRILPLESTFAYNSILISLIYKNYRIQQIVFLLYNMYSNKRYVILTKRKKNKQSIKESLNKQENQRLCNIDKNGPYYDSFCNTRYKRGISSSPTTQS